MQDRSDKEWVDVRQGRIKVLALLQPSSHGKSATYRARCDCGRFFTVRRSELVDGISNCGCDAKSYVRSAMAAYAINGAVPQAVAKVYNDCKDRCPSWWSTTLPQVVDGLCNMIARQRYTDELIAKWWDCPIEMVFCVRETCTRRICTLVRDYEALIKAYRKAVKTPSEDGYHRISSEWDGIASLSRALSGKSLHARISRRGFNDY